MKKVININFQGRVIPIEESAFDLLKQYIESLRVYFAGEEGRDEIINDIESRIAELFGERLQHGAPCITDEDTQAVIATIGRPEDFEAEEGRSETKQQQQTNETNNTSSTFIPPYSGRGSLYRNADDKVLGGVCSGLANYLRLDPVIIRILFVLLFGALFLVYILLWLIVPSRSLQTSITKRLYRNPEGKVIAGVASGIAAYFNIEIWIPRLIFALPILITLTSSPFNRLMGWGGSLNFVSGSLASTMVIAYIIFWIVLPVARSAAERLEMKGEKIDLNSIRDTVKDNLDLAQVRAQKIGEEVRQSAQRIQKQHSGTGSVIRGIFKVIFYFFAGTAALCMLGILIGLTFGSMAVFPLKDLVLEGTVQNTLAWCTVILVLGVPVVAIATWLIRRIAGIRSQRHYLGYVFTILFVAGVCCAIGLGSLLYQDFKFKHSEATAVAINQPGEQLIISAGSDLPLQKYSRRFWADIDDEDMWLLNGTSDSVILRNVKVHVEPSSDSFYHVYTVRYSRGSNGVVAKEKANSIGFAVRQDGNKLLLPTGLSIPRKDKFRNQQVMVVIEVPNGKQILFDKSLDHYSWITFRNNGANFNITTEDFDDEHSYNTVYTMTGTGLKNSEDNSTEPITTTDGKRMLGNFTAVTLDGSMNVELHNASQDYVTVTGNADDVAHVHTKVKNGTLNIEDESNWNWSRGKVTVHVYVRSLEQVELNGSGNITGDQAMSLGDEMELTLNGSGNIRLQGQCRMLRAAVSGSGEINAAAIRCEQAVIDVSGSGNITVNASKSLEGSLSGSGNVHNKGNATSGVSVTGSGTVSKG
jgi:phage shock protein PspC (stress-responsive transcriptional regulator)